MITCKCGQPAVVQWKRRPTADEAQQATAAEAPPPADAPAAENATSDSATDSYVPVYACADHALTPDAAALMHQATCSGPARNGNCDCTPETAPSPEFPGPEEPGPRLPPGW